MKWIVPKYIAGFKHAWFAKNNNEGERVTLGAHNMSQYL